MVTQLWPILAAKPRDERPDAIEAMQRVITGMKGLTI
jgi:hypothetical protein